MGAKSVTTPAVVKEGTSRTGDAMGYAKAKNAVEVDTPTHIRPVKIGDGDVTVGRWRAASRLLSLRFAALLIESCGRGRLCKAVEHRRSGRLA